MVSTLKIRKSVIHLNNNSLSVGTSVQSSAFAQRSSFPLQQCLGHLEGFSLYVSASQLLIRHLAVLIYASLRQAAISNMDGIGGKPAWAWIFILEGLLTVIAGAMSFWIIQDFPDTAKFLTEAERTVVIRRLQEDDQFSAAGEKLKWKYIWQSLLDWKTWLGSRFCQPSKQGSISDKTSSVLLYMGSDGPLYAFSLFLPSIINEVSHTNALLVK